MTDYDESFSKYVNSVCGNGDVFTSSRRKVGSVNSDYRALKVAGGYIKPRPYHISTAKLDSPDGIALQQYSSGSYVKQYTSDGYYAGKKYIKTTWYDYAGIASFPKCYGDVSFESPARTAEDHAASNFNASLQGLSTANLGVTMIELKETIGLVGNTALTLAGVYKNLRRGNLSGAIETLWNRNDIIRGRDGLPISRQALSRQLGRSRKKHNSIAQNASSSWLELQFGWLPLLSDIHDIAETTATHLYAPEPEMITIHGYGSSKGAALGNSNYTATGSYHRKVAYHAAFKITDPNLYALNKFGLVNPLSVAWEVVPFSFVVDWFLPVGNYLNSLTATAGLERLGGCKSVKIEVQSSAESTPLSDAYTKKYCSATHSLNSFTRTVTNADPAVPLKPVNPLELLDGWHTLTSLALLKQVFS